MNEKLISVIIITYNNEKYIEDCIKSVINQTYKNIEILIIDDGSIDNTSKIVEKYIEMDNRINYIRRKENKGTMYTRQEGYDKSKGEYVFFIDSDDWIEKETIEVLYGNLNKHKVDMIKCNFKKSINNRFFNIANQIKEDIILRKEEFEPVLYDFIYKTIYCNSMCGQLIRREYLKDINKVDYKLIYGEDIQNNLYLFSNINSIEMINEELYIYRCNNNSITNIVNEKKMQDLVKTFDKLYEFIEISNIKDKARYKTILAEKLYNYIVLIFIQLLDNKNKEETIAIVKDLIKSNDKILKNYKKTNYLNNNILYNIAIKILHRKKYNMLYQYISKIYLPIKKIIKG